MAIRKIITEGNDLLRKKSKPVVDFNGKLHTLLDDMKETLKEANGVGLAAPQVGILRRIFIVETGYDSEDSKSNVIEFINPEIVKTKGVQDDLEGCLSVPDVNGYVERPYYVKVKAFDRFGKPFEIELEELSARCVCHEYDHLDGILFIDKARFEKDGEKK